MKLRKADEMEQNHNLKSARNSFVFYTIALATWVIYEFIKTGEPGLEVFILIVGGAVFWWSRTILYRQTETEEKVKIPSKAILQTLIYVIVFLAIILIAGYYF